MLKMLAFDLNEKGRKPFKALRAQTLQMGISGNGKFTLSASPVVGDKVIFGSGAPKDGTYSIEPGETAIVITGGVITAVTPGRQL